MSTVFKHDGNWKKARINLVRFTSSPMTGNGSLNSRNAWIPSSKLQASSFKSHQYDVQSSWSSSQTGRITYNFVNPNDIDAILRTYPSIDRQLLTPNRPCFVTVTYGLEVGVNNVGDYHSALRMIDAYIESKYGLPGDPAVRWSRLENHENTYCTVLRDLATTNPNRFLSEPFDLFDDTPFPPSKPDFLYNLNSTGLPLSSFTSNRQASLQQDSPYVRQQLESLRTQNESMAHTIHMLVANHTDLVRELNSTQR